MSVPKHIIREKELLKTDVMSNVRGTINQDKNCPQDATTAVGQNTSARVESVESPAINSNCSASISQK